MVVYGPLDARTGGYLYDRKVADRLRERGDTVVRVSLPDVAPRLALAHNFDPRIRRRLARLDADVVVVDELCHPSLAGVVGSLPRPTVGLVHHLRCSEPGPSLRRRLDRALERRFLAGCDAYVCNGQTTLAAVARLVDPTPAVVARPGADRLAGDPPTAEAVRARAAEEPLRVVAVGSLVPRKGHRTLLRGLAGVAEPWRLDVCGAEPDREHAAALRACAADLGVCDRVRFHGRVSDDALGDRLDEAHLFALPSRYEGYGIAYLEAMRAGLPVIASSAGGAGEFVDGENGVLVDPGDADAVCRAVERFARDRDALAAAGEAALATARAHPTWAETGDRVRDALHSL
ncbi:MAG: glycosyltransferase family 4 protein [Haloferacaceae archaeon]